MNNNDERDYAEENANRELLKEWDGEEMSVMPSSRQKQQVWRTISGTSHNGTFVWEVIEVMGELTPRKYFTPTRDGGYVLIACNHFFTRERAEEFLNDQSWVGYQEYNIVSESKFICSLCKGVNECMCEYNSKSELEE